MESNKEAAQPIPEPIPKPERKSPISLILNLTILALAICFYLAAFSERKEAEQIRSDAIATHHKSLENCKKAESLIKTIEDKQAEFAAETRKVEETNRLMKRYLNER
jgi:uncharacterized protein HemX